jgi:type II secretion system protein I
MDATLAVTGNRRLAKVEQGGFTLLEALVATAILGTAITALLSLLSGALSNARRIQDPEQALLLGRSQLNELLVAGESSGAGAALPLDQKMEGRWDERFRWEAVATRVQPAEALPGMTILVRIGMDVFWKAEGSETEKRLTLETFQVQQEPARTAIGN